MLFDGLLLKNNVGRHKAVNFRNQLIDRASVLKRRHANRLCDGYNRYVASSLPDDFVKACSGFLPKIYVFFKVDLISPLTDQIYIIFLWGSFCPKQ